MLEIKHCELELLFNLSLDLHCIASTDGYFRHINPAFERILGYSKTELLSRPILYFVHEDDHLSTIGALDALSKGSDVVEFENRYRCADGTYKILQWNSSPEKESGLIAATARDVTRIRELQHQVDSNKQLRALGTVAATVAHDLRNVLMPISYLSSFLGEELKQGEPRSLDAVHAIQKSVERGEDLIEQILQFSENQPNSMTEVNLEQMANEVVGGIRSDQISKSVVVDHVNAVMQGDSTQLYRMLLNLCSNAVDAMPRGGEMRVVLSVTSKFELSENRLPGNADDYIVIQVLDNGHGISAEDRVRIFEPFFTTKRGHGGTGLGLAFAKKVAEQHGGCIRLDQVGKQTRFSIFLLRSQTTINPASMETNATQI